MSINIELALVLGLFVIGAVVLAMDNQVDALRRRLNRSFLRRTLNSAEGRLFDMREGNSLTAVDYRRGILRMGFDRPDNSTTQRILA
jgi:hypothetical protein